MNGSFLPTPLEIEISAMLKTGGNIRSVAAELVSRWRKNVLNADEQRDLAQFLLESGQYPLLIAECDRLLLGRELPTVPWPQFIEAMISTGLTLDRGEAQILAKAAEDQNQLTELTKTTRLDSLVPDLIEKRRELEAARQVEITERKQALKEKLVYMRANRMFEQELSVLDEIQAQFPEEAEVKEAKEALQLRWARNVVSQTMVSGLNTSTADLQYQLQQKAERLTVDQEKQKRLLVKRAAEIAGKDSSLAYDLAIAMHMMEFHSEALEILRFAPQVAKTDWLRLELLIGARQFVAALTETNRLEPLYASEPDSSFTVAYARARSLYGLGQASQAIELLKSIVRLRPHYKSAQSLLSDWNEGDQ